METQTPTSNPSKLVYFKKELLTNSFIIAGRPVPFVAYEGNRGLLTLEDTPPNQPMITALREAASKQKGGIIQITAEEAEAFKKKVNLQTKFEDRSLRRSELRLHSAPPRPKQAATAPVVAEPAADPTGSIRPATPIQRITAPPPEAGFIIPEKPTPAPAENGTTPPARHKPETRRVATPEKAAA